MEPAAELQPVRAAAPRPPDPAPARHGLPAAPQPAPKKRKKWPWIIGAILVLFVIIGVSGGNGGSSPTVEQVNSAAAPAVPAGNAPAPAAQPQASPPTDYSGKGDDVVTIKKDSGPAIVSFECGKCSGNTVLQSDGYDTLLVNAIGSYKGRHLIDANDGSTTSTLTVKATGSWKITVASGLGTALKGDKAASGHGDDVVLLSGSMSKAAITNKGKSNFVVQVYGSSAFPDLAVNTIGGYTGTVPVDGPALLSIKSDGDWSVTGS